MIKFNVICKDKAYDTTNMQFEIVNNSYLMKQNDMLGMNQEKMKDTNGDQIVKERKRDFLTE